MWKSTNRSILLLSISFLVFTQFAFAADDVNRGTTILASLELKGEHDSAGDQFLAVARIKNV